MVSQSRTCAVAIIHMDSKSMKSKIYNVKIAVIVPYMCAVNVTLEISIMKVFCVCKEISVLGDVSMCCHQVVQN